MLKDTGSFDTCSSTKAALTLEDGSAEAPGECYSTQVTSKQSWTIYITWGWLQNFQHPLPHLHPLP